MSRLDNWILNWSWVWWWRRLWILVWSSMLVALPRPLGTSRPTSRSSATTTGATFVGPQPVDGSGRVSELGTDKLDVENSLGLGARRWCEPLCAITHFSLYCAHCYKNISCFGARQAEDVDLWGRVGTFAYINWIFCAPPSTATAGCTADRPQSKQEETHSDTGERERVCVCMRVHVMAMYIPFRLLNASAMCFFCLRDASDLTSNMLCAGCSSCFSVIFCFKLWGLMLKASAGVICCWLCLTKWLVCVSAV